MKLLKNTVLTIKDRIRTLSRYRMLSPLDFTHELAREWAWDEGEDTVYFKEDAELQYEWTLKEYKIRHYAFGYDWTKRGVKLAAIGKSHELESKALRHYTLCLVATLYCKLSDWCRKAYRTVRKPKLYAPCNNELEEEVPF